MQNKWPKHARENRECPHDERILAVHVALNCSNIKTVINAQYMEYESVRRICSYLLTNDKTNKWGS